MPNGGDVSYRMAAALAEASNLGFAYASPVVYQGPLPQDMQEMLGRANDWRDEQELEAEREDAIKNIKADAGLAQNESSVEDAIKAVRNAKSVGDIRRIVSSVAGEVGVASNRAYDRIEPELMRIDRMNAQDRYLYANDPEYRAKIDKLNEDSKKNFEEFEKKTESFERIVQEKGLTSTHDEEIAALEEEVKKARAEGNNQRAFELDAALAKENQSRVNEIVTRNPNEFSPEVVNQATAAADNLVQATEFTKNEAQKTLIERNAALGLNGEQSLETTQRVALGSAASIQEQKTAALEETLDFGDPVLASLASTMTEVSNDQTAALAKPTTYRDPSINQPSGGLSA